MPPPDFEWFFPFFVAFWLAICGVLSMIGGWYELSRRFKSNEGIDGERFSLRSGAIGWGAFSVSYGGCLFITVGPKGIALSILFLFRFLHPRLVIPWSAIERCETVRFWFMKHVAVHVKGFNRRLLFRGPVGKRILEAWAQAGRGSRPVV